MYRLCLPLLLLLVLGCGSGPKLVPVSGTITLDDEPLGNVKIITQPLGNPDDTTPGFGSFAVTDAEGHFSLELQSDPRPGAIPGEHGLLGQPKARFDVVVVLTIVSVDVNVELCHRKVLHQFLEGVEILAHLFFVLGGNRAVVGLNPQVHLGPSQLG